jgi:hypothetical protein
MICVERLVREPVSITMLRNVLVRLRVREVREEAPRRFTAGWAAFAVVLAVLTVLLAVAVNAIGRKRAAPGRATNPVASTRRACGQTRVTTRGRRCCLSHVSTVA